MFSSNASQVSDSATYIEDVFSTYLYTGTGVQRDIVNGIDLATEGGMVWIKRRGGLSNHAVVDTARGVRRNLRTNTTDAELYDTLPDRGVNAFLTNGFSLGTNQNSEVNGSGDGNLVSWTFRKQPKFFDVVTYTGNGTSNRPVAHSLASVPGCIIIKSTGTVTNWMVWHRSLSVNNLLVLNSTAAQANYATLTIHDVTSTNFQVDNYSMLNASGVQYVAYVFAHDAGGFGLTGTDNVISCGSFTTDASGNASVTIGYEPQWLMYKRINATGNWNIVDTTRGMSYTADNFLFPNLSNAETVGTGNFQKPTATGFQGDNTSYDANSTFVYIAIRRGPMKTPTTGTSVFTPIARTGTGTVVTVTGFQGPLDSVFVGNRTDATDKFLIANRLTAERYTRTSSTAAETVSVTAAFPVGVFGVMNGFNLPATTSNVTNKSATTYINYGFTRAPGFMDVCCYTGTGVARTVAHNLGVAPELMIVKNRTSAQGWAVYTAATGNTKGLSLEWNGAAYTIANFWNNTSPTSTVFTVGNGVNVNELSSNFVAYLFASCPGVSKVGSYTGTGTTQQINCGFTGGARFVLIKRTDSTGDWYVWDSARGIVAGNDPYLLLNSTAAEVTSTDYVDTYSAGFEISSTAPAAINASGGSFIFLAIA